MKPDLWTIGQEHCKVHLNAVGLSGSMNMHTFTALLTHDHQRSSVSCGLPIAHLTLGEMRNVRNNTRSPSV